MDKLHALPDGVLKALGRLCEQQDVSEVEFFRILLQFAPSVPLQAILVLWQTLCGVNGSSVLTLRHFMACLALTPTPSPYSDDSGQQAVRLVEREGAATSTPHGMRITEARYVPQLNAFFTLEEGQSRVTVYRASPRDPLDANSGFEVLGHMEGEATVFGFEYIEALNVAVLAQGNFTLKFWDCRPALERGGNEAKERSKARAAAEAAKAAAAEAAAATAEQEEEEEKKGGEEKEEGKEGKEGGETGEGQRSSGAGTAKTAPPAPSRSVLGPKVKDLSILRREPLLTLPTSTHAFPHCPLPIISFHLSRNQRHVAYLPHTGTLITGGVEPGLLVFDLLGTRIGFDHWKLKVKLVGELPTASSTTVLKSLPTLGVVVSGGGDGELRVWGEVGAGDGWGGARGLDSLIPTHPYTVVAGAKAPPGAAALAAGKPPTTCRAGPMFLLSYCPPRAHPGGIRAMAFSPGTRQLFTVGFEPYTQVYDLGTEGALHGASPRYLLGGGGVAPSTVAICGLECMEEQLGGGGGASGGGGGWDQAAAGLMGGESECKAALAARRRDSPHFAHLLTIGELGEMTWWDVSRVPQGLTQEARRLQCIAPKSTLVASSSDLPSKARGLVVVRSSTPAATAAAAESAAAMAATAPPAPATAATIPGCVLEASREGDPATGGLLVITLANPINLFEVTSVESSRCVPRGAAWGDDGSTGGGSLVVVSEREIRVFDGVSGEVKRVFLGALPEPVTGGGGCFALVPSFNAPLPSAAAAPATATGDTATGGSDSGSGMGVGVGVSGVCGGGGPMKALVGCSNGSLLALCPSSGLLLKAYPRHYGEVTGVVAVVEDGIVVSAGGDGRVHVSDDRMEGLNGRRRGLIRRVKQAHGRGSGATSAGGDGGRGVTALAVDHTLSFIATAGGAVAEGREGGGVPIPHHHSDTGPAIPTPGTLRVWDYQDLTLVADIPAGKGGHTPATAPITALAWLSPYSVLVAGDAGGVMSVWSINRSGTPPICLATLHHTPCPDSAITTSAAAAAATSSSHGASGLPALQALDALVSTTVNKRLTDSLAAAKAQVDSLHKGFKHHHHHSSSVVEVQPFSIFSLPPPTSSSTSTPSNNKPVVDNAFSSALTPMPSVLLSPTTWGPAALATSHFPPLTPTQVSHTIGHLVRMTCVPPPLPPHHYSPTGEVSAPREPAGITSFLVLPSKASLARVPLRSPLDAMSLGREVCEGVADDFSSGTLDFPILVVGDASGRVSFYDTALPLSKLEVTLLEPLHSPATLDLQPSAVAVEGEVPLSITTPPTPTEGGGGKGGEEEYIPYTSLLSLPSSILQPELSPRDTSADHHQQSTVPSFFNSPAPSLHAFATNSVGVPKGVEEGQHKQNQPRFLARIRPVLPLSSPTSHLSGNATGTSAGAFAGVAGFPPVYTLRRSQEPLDPSKIPPLHQGYNPRKTVKLVGREPWVHRPVGKEGEEEEEVTLEGTQVNNTSAYTMSSNVSSVISSGPSSFPVPSSSKSGTVGATSTTPSTSAATHYSVSVLAQIMGQLWHPTVVRNVHGLHHQRAVGAPPQWRGFPVASLSFSRTPGFTGIVSSGEDGTVRVLSVGERGEGGGAGSEAAALGSLLGSLSVAVGRKSGGDGGGGGEGGQVIPPTRKAPSAISSAKEEKQKERGEQEKEEEDVNEAQLTGDFWGPFVDVGARAKACDASMAALRARLGEKAWEVGKLDFLNDNRVKLQYQGKGSLGGGEGGSAAAKGGGVGGKGDAPLSFAYIRDDALRQLKFIAASATPAPPPLATDPATSSSSTSSSTSIATPAGGPPTSSLEIVPPLELLRQLVTLGRESSERSLPPTPAAAAAVSTSSAPPVSAPAPSPAAIKRLGIVESLTARSTRGRGVGGFDQYNIKSRLTLRNEEEDDTSEALSAMVMEVPSAAGSTAAQGGLTTTTSSTTPSSPSLSAQHRERESAMERIRALAFSGSMRPEACVVKIGGVGMVDPVASARILSTLEREKRAYPSYFAEAAKGLGVGGGGGGGKPSSSPNTATSSKSPSGSGGAGGGGGAHSQRLSPFLAANLHRLEGGATGGGGGKIKLTSPHSSRKPTTTPTTTTTTTLPSLPLNLPTSSKLLHQTPISPQQRQQQGTRKLTINTAANLSYSAAPPTLSSPNAQASSSASATTPASPSPNAPHSLSFSSSSSTSNILLNPTVIKSLPSEFRGLLLSPLASVGGGKGGFSMPSGSRLGAAGGDSGSDGESGEEGGDETRGDGGKIPLDLARELLRGASVPLDLLGDTSSSRGGGMKEGGEGEELGRGGFGTKKIQPSSAKLILQRALGDAYGSLRNAPAVAGGAAGAGSDGVGGGGLGSVRPGSPPPVGLSPPPRSPTPASPTRRGGAASPTSNGSSAAQPQSTALRLADFESRSELTPEEYAQLFNQHSVCGVKKKELADLLFLLHAVDEDRNGKLDMNEWLNFNSNFTKRVGVNKDTVKTKEELMKIMGDMDVDKSGFLTLDEVLRAMYPKKSLLERKVLRAFLCYSGPTEVAMAASAAQQGAFSRETLEAVKDLFRLFDVDDSQTVSMEEMERLLGDSLGDLGGNSVTAKRRRREVVMEVCAGLPTIQGGPFHGHLSFEAFLQLMGPVMEMEGRMLPL